MISFSDLEITSTLDGEKKTLNDILDKKIVITGHSVKPSKYNKKGNEDYVTIQFYFEEDTNKKPYVVFTGSNILREQLDLAFEKLEEMNEESFSTTVTKIGSYYSFK